MSHFSGAIGTDNRPWEEVRSRVINSESMCRPQFKVSFIGPGGNLVVERLPSLCGALGSIASTTKNRTENELHHNREQRTGAARYRERECVCARVCNEDGIARFCRDGNLATKGARLMA